MAAANTRMPTRPVAIAPASTGDGANGDSPQPPMPYACQSCAKRKVKCDKTTPTCATCRKGKLECFYQAPPPRRKRKLSGDANGRPSRNEQHQAGSQSQDADGSISIEETPKEPVSLQWNGPDTSIKGKLIAGQGKSRYIDSTFWHTLGEDEMQRMTDDDEEDQVGTSLAGDFTSDPLTGAIMGFRQSLLDYHPTQSNAMTLWKTHVQRVEPLCKILHIPSTLKIVEMASQQPATSSKSDECLLFAIYHFAVFSMTDEECVTTLGQSRAALMQKYHFATRQALVNASFLRTTEMSILQSLVLFLLPCRYSYDPHTYWILTGVAVRIAQRMGIQRDGEKLGMSPFDVQMRRRLFYQLLPLDGIASQMSGTGMGTVPTTWDTQPALNINDDQIWPGMAETPEEQKGATDMIFCLARACIGKSFASTGKSMAGAGSRQFKDYEAAEAMIRKAESEVEEKYIRYCDIVNPLHFLTIALARCGINAMRMRIRIPKIRDQTATDADRRELFQLSQKIIDTDTAVYGHASLRRTYQWHVRSFFLWGTWDSMILILTCLGRTNLLSPAEIDGAWSKIEQIYTNHGELLESKRALHVAFGRLTLKAWEINPTSGNAPEPAFITTLRSRRKVKRHKTSTTTLETETSTTSPTGPSPASVSDALFGSLSGSMGLDMGHDFTLDLEDWMFWDQLIQEDQAHGGFSQ
ncbi:Fc.00g094410.m01.CDS01 [Cosmosporella sp. VM-42]